MRINFLGGPGSGKSTSAAHLFSVLKRERVSVELVTEYVKAWACQHRKVNSFDQIYLLGKQMQYEYRFLSAGIKNIVTDSPVMLSAIYAHVYYKELNIAKSIMELVDIYEKSFPSLNIFLRRKDKPYFQEGRFQTYEQAKQIDDIILQTLKEKEQQGWRVIYLDYDDDAAIARHALDNVKY